MTLLKIGIVGLLTALGSFGMLLAGLAWFAPPGYATETLDSEVVVRPSFEVLDTNGDNVITPTEAEGTWLAEVFGEVDVNQDGLVNRNEYETGMA